MRSPKAKYSATAYFDSPVKGLGSSVTLTSDNMDELKSNMCSLYGHIKGQVIIRENKKTYPEFNWHTVEKYNIGE